MDRGTADFYDHFAAEKAAEYAKTRSAVARHFEASFARGARVLDVGSGSARDLSVLCELGFDGYGIEPHAGMRAFAARLYPALASRMIPGTLPELGQPFGGAFDAVVCSAVLMHVSPTDLETSLRAMLALLVPHGRLFLTLPALREDLVQGDRDDEGRQYWNHRPEGFEALLVSLGCRRLGRWDNDTVLATTGTLWHMWLFEC